MTANLPWYVARSSGLVAWALISASVVWGLVFSGRLSRTARLPGPAWTMDVHRFSGGLAVVFVALHIGGLMFDRFVSFGVLQVAVPFTSHWRPWAVAWGVVGVYLLVAISVTSALMSRLPRRLWHGVHLTSFGLFVTMTVHALTAGTDVRHGGWRWAMFGALAAVGVLGVVRMVMGGRRRAPARRSGGRPTGSRPVPVGQSRVRPVADGPCTRADEDGALRRRAATATFSAPSSATAAQTVNRRPRPLRAPGREPSRT